MRWACLCLSVCPLAYLKKQMSKLREISCTRVNCGSGSVHSDDNAIRGVLLVLWLTLCLSIIGQAKTMPKGLYSLGGRTGAKSDVYDSLDFVLFKDFLSSTLIDNSSCLYT